MVQWKMAGQSHIVKGNDPIGDTGHFSLNHDGIIGFVWFHLAEAKMKLDSRPPPEEVGALKHVVVLVSSFMNHVFLKLFFTSDVLFS